MYIYIYYYTQVYIIYPDPIYIPFKSLLNYGIMVLYAPSGCKTNLCQDTTSAVATAGPCRGAAT